MRGSREISLVPSLHRASTDALILCLRIAYLYFNIVCGGDLPLVSPGVPRYCGTVVVLYECLFPSLNDLDVVVENDAMWRL